MHGYGIVLDFEGSLHDGFREVGYIRIKNFEIIDAKEITVGSGCKEKILRSFLENAPAPKDMTRKKSKTKASIAIKIPNFPSI